MGSTHLIKVQYLVDIDAPWEDFPPADSRVPYLSPGAVVTTLALGTFRISRR